MWGSTTLGNMLTKTPQWCLWDSNPRPLQAGQAWGTPGLSSWPPLHQPHPSQLHVVCCAGSMPDAGFLAGSFCHPITNHARSPAPLPRHKFLILRFPTKFLFCVLRQKSLFCVLLCVLGGWNVWCVNKRPRASTERNSATRWSWNTNTFLSTFCMGMVLQEPSIRPACQWTCDTYIQYWKEIRAMGYAPFHQVTDCMEFENYSTYYVVYTGYIAKTMR